MMNKIACPVTDLLKYRLKTMFIDRFGSAHNVRRKMREFEQMHGISYDRQNKHFNIRMLDEPEIKDSILIQYAQFLSTTVDDIKEPYTAYLKSK